MLQLLHRLATGRNVLILLVLDLLRMMGVMPYLGKQLDTLTGGTPPLDLAIPTYSPKFAHASVATYGEAGRAYYRSIELGADLVYPLVYGFAFALLLAFLWQRLAPHQAWTRFVPLLPLVGMLFDYAENLSIVALLDRFPAQPDGLARLAVLFTLLKWSFAFAGIAFMLVGLSWWLLRGRPKLALPLWAGAALLFLFSACGGVSEPTAGDTAALAPDEVVTTFFNWYDSELPDREVALRHPALHPHYVDSIQQILAEPELDYDPIVNAQDCICCHDGKQGQCTATTESITGDRARVKMNYGFGEFCCYVDLVKVEGEWKIYSRS